MTALFIIGGWFIVSIPAALLIGRIFGNQPGVCLGCRIACPERELINDLCAACRSRDAFGGRV